MPVFEDWLNEPLSIVNNIFTSDPINFEQKVNKYFDDKFATEKNYFSIPCLNEVQLHELKPNCLVRYRCMIQDSFDPIYYASSQKFKNKTTNETIQLSFKYKEHLEIPEGFEEYNELENQNIKSDNTLEEAMETHFSKKNQNNLQQRMTFYCVPIPGETEWVKNTYKSNSSSSSVKSVGSSSNTSHRPSKRTIDPNESSEEVKPIESCLSEVTNNKPVEVVHNQETQSSENQKNTVKKTKTEEECAENKVNLKNVNKLNFPLSSSETGYACLVKTYDNFEDFRINDIVEFVGILSQEPSLAYEQDENADMHQQNFQMSEKLMSQVTLEESSMDTDESKSNDKNDSLKLDQQNGQVLSSFPPSLVPRLHCLRSMHLLHNNPILNKQPIQHKKEINTEEKSAYWIDRKSKFLESLKGDATTSEAGLLKLRGEILSCFQEMLLGDSLAAEYLLMHLLSTVFMRKDVTVLGKFSLNIMNVPLTAVNNASENNESSETFTEAFYKALNQFVTMSHMYEFSIGNLNKSNLIPCKDYDKNKLITGMLQLPNHFQLILDETKLNAGDLSTKGLLNFNSVKDLISNQKVDYDFNYHRQEFPTNIRVLTLSDTKSILPCDCALKLKPNVERFDASYYENIIFDLLGKRDSNLLNNFRTYLTILTNYTYTIPDSVQKIVEEDIVNIKKDFLASASNKTNSTTKGKLIDIDAIHNIMIVARLQSLSYGHSELSLNEWNNAKHLEFERLHNRV